MHADTQPAPPTWTDVMGPLIQFVTPVVDEDGYCVIRALFPAGTAVPVHSHPDRETLVILAGELEGWLDGAWRTYRTGEVMDIPGGRSHALRPAFGQDVTLLLVTTMRIGRFFQEIGLPVEAGRVATPSADRLAALVATSHRYGYWLGGPDDNAAAGLVQRS